MACYCVACRRKQLGSTVASAGNAIMVLNLALWDLLPAALGSLFLVFGKRTCVRW